MNRIVEPGNPFVSAGGVGETATRLTVQPVILADGAGTRAWPLSCERHPKRLIDLMGDESLLETMLSRLDASFVAAQRAVPDSVTRSIAAPLLVCGEDSYPRTREPLERLARSGRAVRMVLEPLPRDTAPALTVAALAARAAAPASEDPLIVALPADHRIADHLAFGAALAEAFEHAARGAIVTLGVPPRRAETGFGYIRTGAALGSRGARAIERFVEKPDPELAERYAACGNYWWNSGMVVVRASVWLAAVALCQPAIAEACAAAFEHAALDGDGTLRLAREEWLLCPSASIDYAVMARVGSLARLACVAVPFDMGRSAASGCDSVVRVARGEECFLLTEKSATTKSTSTPMPLSVARRPESPRGTLREMIEVHSGGYPGEHAIAHFEDPFSRKLESAHAGESTSR